MTAALTVASFNARAGIDARGHSYDVGAVVASLQADVIAVQETVRPVDREGWPAAVAAQGGYRLLQTDLRRVDLSARGRIRARADGRYWWGLALFSRLPVTEHWTIDLGRIPTDSAPRAAIVADLAIGIRAVAVHSTHRVPLALVQLRRLARSLPRDATPTVVLGDMNLWGLFVDRAFPGWERPVRGRSWPAHRPLAQIDHIVTSGLGGAASGHVLGQAHSDHRPIRATLAIKRSDQ